MYALIQSGVVAEYPYTYDKLKATNPDTSWPAHMPIERLQEYGVHLVVAKGQPEFNTLTQRVIEVNPVYNPTKGQWEQVWEIGSKTQDEITQYHNIRWDKIKQERDRRTHNGGYIAAGKWFHSDTFSRSQQLGLVLLGNNIPVGMQWKTMDGSFVEMTPTLAQGIFQSAALSDSNIFAYAEGLNQQVLSAENPETIDIYLGWPECYLDLA